MTRKFCVNIIGIVLMSGALFIGASSSCVGQGIQGLYVEPYYTAGVNDYDSTAWIPLKPGTTTWRVFVDLAPGWKVQALYGSPTHPLEISTSTRFYNDPLNDEARAELLDPKGLATGHAILDSWLAMGCASARHIGVPKSEDSDGSLFSAYNKDTLLGNQCEDLLFGLCKSDGLIPGKPADVNRIGADLIPFQGRTDVSSLRLTNGALAVVAGVRGATASNYVLLGQFTTDGELTLELNLQLIRPDGTSEQYVARNPIGSEVQSDYLLWKSTEFRKPNNHTNNH